MILENYVLYSMREWTTNHHIEKVLLFRTFSTQKFGFHAAWLQPCKQFQLVPWNLLAIANVVAIESRRGRTVCRQKSNIGRSKVFNFENICDTDCPITRRRCMVWHERCSTKMRFCARYYVFWCQLFRYGQKNEKFPFRVTPSQMWLGWRKPTSINHGEEGTL